MLEKVKFYSKIPEQGRVQENDCSDLKQEAAQKFQSLQQDINFLREKTNQFRNQTLQLISQEQAEKFQVIVTELIRAKGITLLINSGGQQQTLLHADQSYDITQEVIDAMNEKED